MSKKGFILVVMSFILGLVTLFTIDNKVSADIIPESNNISMSLQEQKEARIISNNLYFGKKDGTYQFFFDKNDKFTADALKSEHSKLTMEDISAYVDTINQKLKDENGNGPLTSALLDIYKDRYQDRSKGKKKKSDVCKWTFSGAGMFQSAVYTAAGIALGASAVATGVIPFAVGALYTVAGNLVC